MIPDDPPSLGAALQSKCLTVCAGEEGRILTVHETVLRDSGSPSLQNLVQTGWRESSEGCIKWEHTNEQTVERVLTFLYYGDYSSPDPTPRVSRDQQLDPNGLNEESDARDDGNAADADERADDSQNIDTISIVADDMPPDSPWDSGPAVPDPPPVAPEEVGDEDLELQNALLESCSTRPLTPLGRCVGLPGIVAMRRTAGGSFECEDFPYRDYSYRAPLFAHAEVYAFATYHQLPGLQELALQRMTQTLRRIDCSINHAQEELTEVIEFVYDNVPASTSDEEPMRKVLSQFGAINYTSLLTGKFEELLSKGGDFALSLARKLSRRLTAHGVATESQGDDLEQRIQNLESQLQERDESIRSLNNSLNDTLAWGRGINQRGGGRR